MATCEELATQLATAQKNLADAQAALNSTNLAIATASLGILGSDPGAIVPLNATNVALRIAQLMAGTPPNYALIAQYVALQLLLAQYAATVTQIAFIQLTITGIQAQQQQGGCV
jgi:hypothetical protein